MVRVVSSRLLAVWLLTAVEAALERAEVAVWLLTAVEVADAALLCERADVGVWLLIAVVASSVLSGRLRSSRAALLAVRLLLGVWLLTAVDAADAALLCERADVAVWLAVAVASSVLLRGRRRSSREEARLLVLGVWLLTAVEVADGAL